MIRIVFNKRIKALLGLLLLLTSLSRCDSNFTTTTNISGQFETIKNQFIYLIKSNQSTSWDSFEGETDSIWVDSQGMFTKKKNIEQADFYQLKKKLGGKYVNVVYGIDIFIEPNKDISFKIIENNIKFEDPENPNNLQSKIKDISETNNQTLPNHKRFALDLKEFISHLNTNLTKEYQTLKQDDSFQELNKRYKNYLTTKIALIINNERLQYLQYHLYYSTGNMDYLINNEIENLWSFELPYSQYYFIDSYNEVAGNTLDFFFHYNNRAVDEEEKWKNEFNWKFNFIKNNYNHLDKIIAYRALPKNYWIYLSVSSSEFYNTLAFQKKEIEETTNSEDLAYLKNHILGLIDDFDAIGPGNIAPDFTLQDIDGKHVKLSDFKGDILYLDFWGTWCMPCIEAIPKHKKLKEKLEQNNTDITYVYIALESDLKEKTIKRWRNFVEKHELKGVHLIAENQFNNKQISPYKVTAAPTYILIDKDFKIAHTRAEGPKDVIDDIQILLEE